MADNKVNSGLLEFSEDQKVFVALDAETSEVKKAVTIDEDGVETDIQGVQPSGKKEITSTAEVNVANYATAQVVDEDLVAGNIKKDVDILGVVGSYEGGGSSDFSTANVTFSSATFQTDFSAIQIAEGEGQELEMTYDNVIFGGATGDKTVELVLYKGHQMINLPEGKTASTTGSATIEDYYILVTGVCTITISDITNN